MDAIDKSQFQSLIRLYAQGLGVQGAAALGPLYDLTAPRLYRYALLLTRNRDDAEDVLQAAMVKIVLKPKLLAAAQHPWAYVVRMLRNEVLNLARRRHPVERLSDCESLEAVAGVPDNTELRQAVQVAIRRLPPQQSEVVVLKLWEEMTFAEIADVLGESPNTVASRYRYALEKLAVHLQPLRDEVLDV